MATITIETKELASLLQGLLGRDVGVAAVPGGFAPHPATYKGLVGNDDVLQAVIGCDLDFAHRSGAALAMMPAGVANEAGDQPDPTLLEVYGEVVNVVSRLANEASPSRVRLDPSLVHPPETMQAVIDGGPPIVAATATIAGYGDGSIGIWFLPPS